jgi:hypothetical protein
MVAVVDRCGWGASFLHTLGYLGRDVLLRNNGTVREKSSLGSGANSSATATTRQATEKGGFPGETWTSVASLFGSEFKPYLILTSEPGLSLR